MPHVRTKQDFLNQLPKNVLQKFTFITKSESLQRLGVDEMHPRVMRFRTDGKFIITYTTAKVPGVNDTIEAIFFDDTTRRYNFIHTEFYSEDQLRKSSSYSKTTLNPKSCFACHGGIDPRPNWAQYEKWAGTYGNFDDSMGSLSSIDHPGVDHLDLYTQMRDGLRGTIELETLPWPSTTSPDFNKYPYINQLKLQNYNSRPNAHFTIVGSRLNSQRLVRKMTEYPHYQKVKWSLLAHALECDGFPTDRSPNPILERLLQKNKAKIERNKPLFDVYKRAYGTIGTFIYRFGMAIGFKSTDWSLRFEKTPQDKFEAYNSAQWQTHELVRSVLFTDLAKEEPRLEPYDVRFELMSNMFGRNFMCVDEIADNLWIGSNNRAPICKILDERAKFEIASIQSEDIDVATKWESKIWDLPLERNFGSIGAERGKQILTQTCGQCHTGIAIPYNFHDLNAVKNLMESPGGLGHKMIIAQAIKQCKMPLPISGACLSDEEIKSVNDYLESFIKK